MFQPLFVRPVMASERDGLLRFSQSSNREEAARAEIILLSAEGKTASDISQELGFHPSNVKKWIRRFNEDGLKGIVVKKRGPQGGPRPRFSSDQVSEILRLAKTDPTSLGLQFREWTPQKLATEAVARGIVDRISHVTVRQILKRHEEASDESMSKSKIVASGFENESARTHFDRGLDLLSKSEYERAIDHFSLSLCNEAELPEQEAITRAYLSKALEELSKYEESYAAISKYEDSQVFGVLSHRTRACVKLRLGWVESWLRNYPESIASLNEAKKLYLELEDDLGVSEAHLALGRTYLAINEFRIARDHLIASSVYQKSTVNKELLARVYEGLGVVDFCEGAFSSSKENYLKALDLAKGSANANLLGNILLNLGTVYLHGGVYEGSRGEREESTRYIESAIPYLEKGGHKDYLAKAYNNLGDNFLYSGLWAKAIDCLKRSIEIAEQIPDPQDEATAHVTLAEIFCSKGRFTDAEAHLKRSLDLNDGSADKWLESNANRILARVQRVTGRMDLALRTLRQVLQLSMSIGDLHGVVLAQVGLAECHFLQGGYEQAREYIELAQGRLREEKSLFISGLMQRLTGQLESASGRLAEAQQHIAQSISIFATTEIPYEQARSHYEMGLLLQKVRDLRGAESHLRQAKDLFEKLGAEPDFDLSVKALASIRSGEYKEAEVVRVTSTNDVLLMQRLIEASASRELLLQELASVVYDNFAAGEVIIFQAEEGGRPKVLVSQGLTVDEANDLCIQKWQSIVEPGWKASDVIVVKLGDGGPAAVALYLRVKESLDLNRLQPLLKQAELGLETCLLRASARQSSVRKVEQRIQTIIPGFICCSPQMADVVERIHKIKSSDVTVLITGESGTGKELVARAIHVESARARAIFLPFNCTATPKEIIDSQLFGHRRGAFTGATTNYPGIVKAADGGTLFLDEIGDLSLEVQPKLMRFLQEGEIQPLGETKPIRVDVRILAATNTDLERAVEDGRFREDLFHRLNIIRIHVPPLRERREEIPVLAAYFLDHFSSRSGKPGIALAQDGIHALTEYDWPGNVRQLRNEIERAVAYATEGSRISAQDLSPDVARPRQQSIKARTRPGDAMGGYNGNDRLPIALNGRGDRDQKFEHKRVKLKEATAALERQIIEEALVFNKNNLSRTALDLGLSRRGLRLKLIQLGIERETPA